MKGELQNQRDNSLLNCCLRDTVVADCGGGRFMVSVV
jgi:hypothetical protein